MTQPTHRIVLFANGDLPLPDRLKTKLSKDDILIAVDGGLRYLTLLNLKPNLIIGDLDSADPDSVNHFRTQSVEVREFPPEKDETDLELALNAALEMHPSSIWIVAALGNRLDQTLGNLFLLTKSELAGIDIRLIDGECEVFLINNFTEINGIAGQCVSLIPLGGPAKGIHTKGLKYPLRGETLYPDRTRGISNRLTASSANVMLENGVLLCIHQTTEPTERIG